MLVSLAIDDVQVPEAGIFAVIASVKQTITNTDSRTKLAFGLRLYWPTRRFFHAILHQGAIGRWRHHVL